MLINLYTYYREEDDDAANQKQVYSLIANVAINKMDMSYL